MHVELGAAIGDQPALALLLHHVFGSRLEVLAVETGRVGRGRQIARVEQQYVAEALLARPAGQRQTRAGAGDLAVRIEELVLAITETALIRIAERPVGIELVIPAGPDDREHLAFEHALGLTGRREARLDLNFEALLLDRAADGHQLLQHTLLAAGEEGVNA